MRKISSSKVVVPLWILSLLSIASWTLVVVKLNPFAHTGMALALFLISFLMMGVGFFSLVFIAMKRRWIERDLLYKHYLISIRQGFFLSLCMSVCLFLLILGMLKLWSGFLVLAFMIFVEFYFGQHDEL